MNDYIVKPGDSLWRIAKRMGLDYRDLVEANKDRFPDPDLIHSGDLVKLTQRQGIPSRQAAEQLDNLGGGNTCADGSCSPLKMIQKMSPFNMHPANMAMGVAGLGKYPFLPPPANAIASIGSRAINPRDDAIEPVIPEELLPFMKGAGGLGAIAGMVYKFPELIAALAKRFPNMTGRGAGKVAETFSNVRPVGGNPNSVARTLLANTPEARMSQGLQGGKQIPGYKGRVDPEMPRTRNPYAAEQYPDTPMVDVQSFLRKFRD